MKNSNGLNLGHNDYNNKETNDSELEIEIVGFFKKDLILKEAQKIKVKLKDGLNFNDIANIFSAKKDINLSDKKDILLNKFSIKNDKIVKKYLQQNCLILDKNLFISDNLSLAENIKIVSLLFTGYDLANACISSFGLKDFADKKIKNLTDKQKQMTILSYTVCCPSIIWLVDNELLQNLTDKELFLFENAVKIRIKHGGVVIIIEQ